MVIKGKPRGNGKQLGNYLLLQADNDNVQVFDIRGTSQPNNLRKSLIEMSLTSELTKGTKGLYHAILNPSYSEDKQMTREDWLRAADILEAELKLNNQKRVMVLHEKQGRIHCHVVWERYNHAKGTMISDSYSRLAQDRARKTMERELEHSQTPHRNKRQQDIKKDLTELWRKSKTGAEFVRAAKERGYIISHSNQRRPFMVVDQDGRSFDLVRQLDKVRTKEVRERLVGEPLPSDKEAIKTIRTKQREKSFPQMQEQFTDCLEQFKEGRTAKEQEKELFREKFSAMKDAAVSLVNEQADPAISQSQRKADKMRDYFREQENAKAQRDKKMQQFKEQLSKDPVRAKRKGLEHG